MTLQNQQLLDQQRDLENEIDAQEKLGKNLYDQVKVWSSSFEHQVDKRQKEREVLAQQIKLRTQLQSERLVQKQVRSTIFSKALEGAQQELVEHFASEQEGKRYMTSIITKMRKDLS